jgi:hypothetical protein
MTNFSISKATKNTRGALLEMREEAFSAVATSYQYQHTSFSLSLCRSESSLRHWQLGSQLPRTVRGGAVTLKTSHRLGAPPLRKDLSIDTTFNHSHLAGQWTVLWWRTHCSRRHNTCIRPVHSTFALKQHMV